MTPPSVEDTSSEPWSCRITAENVDNTDNPDGAET